MVLRDTWLNTQLVCTRELYWDNGFTREEADLVNADNLRGSVSGT
jgi:hypothetical protein